MDFEGLTLAFTANKMHIIIFVTSHFVLNTISLQHHREHLFAQQGKFHFGIFIFPQWKITMSIGNSFLPIYFS